MQAPRIAERGVESELTHEDGHQQRPRRHQRHLQPLRHAEDPRQHAIGSAALDPDAGRDAQQTLTHPERHERHDGGDERIDPDEGEIRDRRQEGTRHEVGQQARATDQAGRRDRAEHCSDAETRSEQSSGATAVPEARLGERHHQDIVDAAGQRSQPDDDDEDAQRAVLAEGAEATEHLGDHATGIDLEWLRQVVAHQPEPR